MRPLEDAQRDVLRTIELLDIVANPLLAAAGLVLAETIDAPHSVPPFTNSAMDGYAVLASDTRDAPVRLAVLEDVAAGHSAASTVKSGSAIKIMTGAPLPGGADAVVRVEDTEPGADDVLINVSVAVGMAVRNAGGDVAAGDRVFDPGEVLGPAHIAVLASLGITRPKTHRRPTVAILSTGDEVVAPETETLAPSQIRDTNRPLLNVLLDELGVDVLDLGIVGDDANRLRSLIEQGAADADAILTSGGVSMGEYDLVKQVLAELGSIEFWKVAMQPAKPFAFGHVNGVPLFGLPGNPVSVMVAFEQFVRPALLQMMGHSAIFRPRISAIMEGAVDTDPEKTVFVRVSATYRAGDWRVRSSGGQASNVLSALAAGNAFAVIPRGRGLVEDGEIVDVEMFRWPSTRSMLEVVNV